MDVTCHITFAKRSLRALTNGLDAHPHRFTVMLLLMVLAAGAGLVAGANAALHALR
jgi:hypothetical protein